MNESFYDEQTHSLNPVRMWFHKTRHETVLDLVTNYHTNGTATDIGCGNCVWNVDKRFNVTGVDSSEKMLNYTKSLGRIQTALCCDVTNIPLPNNECELVVASEVLEHIPNYRDALEEITRILKPGGILVCSVPYDTNFSLWKPLFAVQCFYRGYVRNEEYYVQKCGHINHFSPQTIWQAIEDAGLRVVEQFDVKRFTIYTVAKR